MSSAFTIKTDTAFACVSKFLQPMKKLLSLPPNLVRRCNDGSTVFHRVTGRDEAEFFCTCDPDGHRLGSGGGTAWLLQQAYSNSDAAESHVGFGEWLSGEKRILIHGGGQSRRLPAYAPSGKLLLPVPVMRWERGQRLSQTLLDLQLPLFEQLMAKAPQQLHTMVVSGDVLIRTDQPLPQVPEADVVCYGLWLPAETATNHGVFVMSRQQPSTLLYMLQKPSADRLNQLSADNLYLTDIGLWLLSDRAVERLMERCGKPYDLYSEFGAALGTQPTAADTGLEDLTVAVVPLPGGEFYHFGTSREMIGSTLRLQRLVSDQRRIMHHDRKPQQSIFVQDSITEISFTPDNTNIWIENSHVGPHWQLSHDNIITGVPRNDWHVQLAPGECIDVVPVGDTDYVLRRYNIDDRFAGDEQHRCQYGLLHGEGDFDAMGTAASADKLYSAASLSDEANLLRLSAQRNEYRRAILPRLAANWRHSVFYQLDLDDAAHQFAAGGMPIPDPLPADAPLLTRISDAMFRGQTDQAFALLRHGLTAQALNVKQQPRMAVMSDQIVWGRSPVRMDISGGWTDTPPYCLIEGGRVVNLAIELNGQPPLQAYVKPTSEPHIVLRSIDLGASERITDYAELAAYNRVGSPFSIPKAALALAGFLPDFCLERYDTLADQLRAFGCGIELTMMSAVPAGSGLGTSSILAATVLGVLSDFCSLGWDKSEIGHRTLVLEQLLTTGGGWQDQFGGLLGGVKMLETQPGFYQKPVATWLPTGVFDNEENRSCHLLYYTGITRTAKQILAEIVRRMFLNQHEQLLLLRQMKEHALEMHDAIARQDYRQTALLMRANWQQNQRLDSGTNPQQVQRLAALIDDLALGYKLPGAGGGGFLYIMAKDPDAAMRIRRLLDANRLSATARFVDMTLSRHGLQVTRS